MSDATRPPRHASSPPLLDGVELLASAHTARAARVLTPPVLDRVARLHRELDPERRRLLEARRERQARWDAGELPGYPDEEEHPEARGDWRVAPLPDDLLRRRVEITGPVSDPKMVINMLSRTGDGHRADAAMLDFEDSMKPSWDNVLGGVENLAEAARGTLTHRKTDADGEVLKRYELDPEDMPLLMVRVRGLHLDEVNLLVDGEPVSAGLLDLVLAFHHSARSLLDRGRTPKYYVPKCEHWLEARWWNRLFGRLQEEEEVPEGTLRATFLIETLPAAFQMEEILWEIREHAAGLNGGRWDKIFSDIKVLRANPDRVQADRATIGMERPWMRDYALHLIDVCHRHGAFAMGGMAANTPGRTAEVREEQIRKVVEDKELEASRGHDGCWVSHPYFIGPAMESFQRDNQLDVLPDIEPRPDLLPRESGPRTLDGLRTNVRVGTAYLKGWHEDIGCVAWDGLMEDLATLEISRAQTWQWLHHGVELDDGTRITPELVRRVFREELDRIGDELRSAYASDPRRVERELARFRAASEDAARIFTEGAFRAFLTCRSEAAGTDLAERRRLLAEESGCPESSPAGR